MVTNGSAVLGDSKMPCPAEQGVASKLDGCMQSLPLALSRDHDEIYDTQETLMAAQR